MLVGFRDGGLPSAGEHFSCSRCFWGTLSGLDGQHVGDVGVRLYLVKVKKVNKDSEEEIKSSNFRGATFMTKNMFEFMILVFFGQTWKIMSWNTAR